MVKNYLTIAYRNLLKEKLFSLVNIFGLAIGMAACFFIMQYVHFERSYDRFHKDKHRIYRVTYENSRVGAYAPTHPAVGPALKSEFPEVEDYARMVHQSIILGAFSTWSYDDGTGNVKAFNQQFMYDVDPSFLRMFSFPFLFGDPQTALSDRRSVVISETLSNKYFGSANPLGKTLMVDDYESFTVTGVFKDLPENSHIKFDVLISFYMQAKWFDNNDWKWPEFYTYIKLKPSADPNEFETKLASFASTHLGDQMQQNNTQYNFHLQPLTDIHLKSPAMAKEREVHGSERTVYFLLIVGALILVIAWINYINLSTSKSIERAKEIGLRKVVGASKLQLVTQFLFESLMINILAILASAILVLLTLPYLTQLSGKNIGNSIQELFLIYEPWFWVAWVGVFFLGSMTAGLYPALILSSFKIMNVINGKFFNLRSGMAFRKLLVAFQFAVSIALIAGTVIVFNQVSFMRNQDLGYVKDHLLVIQSPLIFGSEYDRGVITFKTELLRNPAITNIATSTQIPGGQMPHMNSLRNFNDNTESNFPCYQMEIDEYFMDTYGIKLAAGRNYRDGDKFLPKTKMNSIKANPIILNQKAIEKLGFKNADDALNKLVYFGWGEPDNVGEIIGVVPNYHQRSMREDYDPIMFFYNSNYMGKYISIQMNMTRPPETISFIKNQYEQAFPNNPFVYFFLDEYFDRQYAADQQFGKVFGVFSGLAIFIAGMGLLGLSTFMISRRTKEIAVRKVLGATIPSMIFLFSKDFVKLIILVNILALPVIYVIADNWLNTFTFRVAIGWMMFLLPAIALFIISLSTVGFQTIKTASSNPVKSLRSE